MSKTIIVTGASSGIGKALAEHLALLKHNVIAVGRNKDALEGLQKLYPANIKIVVADVTNKKDQLKIKDTLDSKETGVYLVHNAGIASPQLLSNLSEKDWDDHYSTNAKAPIFLTKILLPHLKNKGRVLNISSGLAHSPLIAMASYSVSKASIFMWKECCNLEFNKQNILFGSAMPGVVDTPIQASLRSCDSVKFPAVEMFKGFFQRGELLQPSTAAKFLSWLLLEVDDDKFIKGDWNINDITHHQYWAKPGEVKLRKQVNFDEKESKPLIQRKTENQFSFFSIITAKKSYVTTAVIAAASFVAGVLISTALKK